MRKQTYILFVSFFIGALQLLTFWNVLNKMLRYRRDFYRSPQAQIEFSNVKEIFLARTPFYIYQSVSQAGNNYYSLKREIWYLI